MGARRRPQNGGANSASAEKLQVWGWNLPDTEGDHRTINNNTLELCGHSVGGGSVNLNARGISISYT